MARRNDGPACVVCGCTFNRPCEGGCSWAVGTPPVCSRCVEPYLMAELWRLAARHRAQMSKFPFSNFRGARDAVADVSSLERLQRALAHGGMAPTFGSLRIIQRRIEKYETPQPKKERKR